MPDVTWQAGSDERKLLSYTCVCAFFFCFDEEVALFMLLHLEKKCSRVG
jgi:hypothetical protein